MVGLSGAFRNGFASCFSMKCSKKFFEVSGSQEVVSSFRLKFETKGKDSTKAEVK